MLLLTTVDAEQFQKLVQTNTLTLNNSKMLFRRDYDSIRKYLESKFGSDGYVIGIRGKLSNKSATVLEKLDLDLHPDRFIIEVRIPWEDTVSFQMKAMPDIAKALYYGLDSELLQSKLDSLADKEEPTGAGITVVCAPRVTKDNGVKITSLDNELSMQAPIKNVTVVNIRGGHSVG